MEHVLIFLTQIVVFSLPLFFITAFFKDRQTLAIYVYMGIVLFIGGFMGSIYSFELSESVTISGGNLTYGAFMMAATLIVIIERDIGAFRNVVVLVITVNLFKLISFSGFSWTLNTDGILNPFNVSPEVFSISVGFMILGGTLIVAELLLLIVLFERIKSHVTNLFAQLLLYTGCYIAILCLDGVAFPLIAFMFNPNLVDIIVGGLGGKLVMATAYGISMLLFFLIFREKLLRFAEQPLVFRDFLHLSRSELIRTTLESEERYQKLVETAHDLIWSIDTEGRITFMNQASNRIYGRQPEEMIGHMYTDFIPPEQIDVNESTWGTALQSNDRIQNFENWVTHKDGHRVLLSANAVLLRDEHGELIGSMGTSQDITERKANEQKLQFQSHLLSAVQEAVIATDLSGKVIYWNDYATQMYGWTEEQALDQNISTLTVPNMGHSQALEIMHKLRLGQRWSGEFSVMHKDGIQFPAIVTNSPIFNEKGELSGIIGISRDISERKKLEDDLRINYERLQMSQEIGHVGSWEYDLESKTIWGSKEGFRIYGLESDPEGRLPLDQIESRIVERERIHQALIDLINEDKPYELEFAIEPVGSQDQRIISSVAKLIRNNTGEPVRVIGVVQDVTRHRLAEQQLQQAKERLTELSRQLITAQENERRRIARELHDELGQGLMILKLDLELLRDQIKSNNEEYNRLEDSIQLVDDVMTQMRSLSMELRPSLLDDLGLYSALRGYVNSFQSRTSIVVDLSIASEIRFEDTIETAIFRCVQEALTNVVRHAGAQKISIVLDAQPEVVKVTIEDDGSGFDPSASPEIGRIGGTGLSGMKERLALINGTVKIDSSPGAGTRIEARVPISGVS